MSLSSKGCNKQGWSRKGDNGAIICCAVLGFIDCPSEFDGGVDVLLYVGGVVGAFVLYVGKR
jgi:hypothetical protein